MEIVKSRRYFQQALRKLIPNEKERLNLKERSRYIAINPDNDIEQEQRLFAIKVLQMRRKSIARMNFSDGFVSDRDSDSIDNAASNPKIMKPEESSSSNMNESIGAVNDFASDGVDLYPDGEQRPRDI